MKNKILLFINIVLLVVYINIGSTNKDSTSFFNNENEIIIKDMKTGIKETMKMEEYLIGVVSGEMPASFNDEALKAQAIAARTYAYYKVQNSKSDYDITTDSSTQVHLSLAQMRDKWNDDYEYYYAKIKKAVADTKDEVITYNGNIISAYYYAMSNGYTEDSINAFNERKAYLKTTVSMENVNNKNYINDITIPQIDFCNILEIECKNVKVTNVTKNESNRVSLVTIGGKTYTGLEVRKLFNLRSTDFDIDITDNLVKITTRGFGHGVGMSQYGANEMANAGYNYKEILSHYYQNTEIQNVNSII